MRLLSTNDEFTSKQWFISWVKNLILLSACLLCACSPTADKESINTSSNAVADQPENAKVPPADIVIQSDEVLPMEQRGGEFTLYAKEGAVSLSDFKGKVVAIYFGYTQCPDICPTNLALLSSAVKQLSADELKLFQGIFISVDPVRDSPEHLAEYTTFFHPKIMGISGVPADLDPVVAQYGAYYEKTSFSNSALLYGVSHTSETYIVGKNGKLAEILPHAAPAKDILQAIRSAM